MKARTMPTFARTCITALALAFAAHCLAQAPSAPPAPQVVDIPTRVGVTQRVLVASPSSPAKATAILFAGGHGGLQITPDGSLKWGAHNFLVRNRQRLADGGLRVIMLDAPSDRQTPPYLAGFRQRPDHVADVKAVIAWARAQSPVPVWLVGTSRGTQSAAYVATELSGAEGPDGVVLTSTILSDNNGRPVPAMPLHKITVPVLVVHHEQDGCALCGFDKVPELMARLDAAPKKALLSFTGGSSQGDPCEAMAYHGFHGIDGEVVSKMAAWMLGR